VALIGAFTRPASADPYGAFSFAVELMGVISAGFNEVSGLQSEVEVTDYREGGNNEYVHKVAGPAVYRTNLVLKRGYTNSFELWDWHAATLAGAVRPLPISVLLHDRSGEPKWRWTFRDAYPVKWVGPALRGSTAEVAVETLELAHHGLLLPQSGLA
jgi:phage tail-like protein